ncbi:methionine ABC transporter substrate-binding lipoprotein MetQ [Salinibius halmophilus]|uniref:methionine ABC transporter substrate-binding lipoprotein MetQ n=1 Tax=Salinibius halmophilus TaxID=1853216 RepID=UPI000E667A8D|nr:methionine ABC transporter substrate-binding lipoprotein MetQ [Salinibius halmophilus]
MKKLFIAATAIATLLTGCGQSDNSTLKLGVMAGAEAQVAEVAAQVAEREYGLSVELIEFNDYVTPNSALDEGSIDANAFQHRPYLDAQVADRGYDFEVIGNTLVYPIAGYSQTIEALNELADGAKIAVPNDPTNLGRALILLQAQGLITLADGAGLEATVLDIVNNPKNLEIVELEAPQLPRALADVAIAIINNTYAAQVDLNPNDHGLFVEDADSPYVNLIVARADNADDPRLTQFVKAYQTDEVLAKANELFNNGVVKGW